VPRTPKKTSYVVVTHLLKPENALKQFKTVENASKRLLTLKYAVKRFVTLLQKLLSKP
jgi:hypothetical protein